MAGGFDYLDEGKKLGAVNKGKLSNLQTDQTGLEESPAEGGEGYIGGNPNASSVGFDYVSGKKGYSEDKPIWSQQSSGEDQDMGAPEESMAGTDSTDEKASYKEVRNDEGLPQTYRTSKGAGDAGPADPAEGQDEVNLNVQNHPSPEKGDESFSEMPQTEFTSNEGGGAPKFKHSGS